MHLNFDDDETAFAVARWLVEWCEYPNDASRVDPQQASVEHVLEDILSSLPRDFNGRAGVLRTRAFGASPALPAVRRIK